jgi:co-chaperonin GroES (HSP10)
MVGGHGPLGEWGGGARIHHRDEVPSPIGLPITLAGDRVLIKITKDEAERKLPSGLLLPDNVDKRDDAPRGTVMGFGPGFTTHQGVFVAIETLIPEIHLGALVAFQRNGVSEQRIKFDHEDYLIVRSAEVCGVLRG